jgi:hypothetical protein
MVNIKSIWENHKATGEIIIKTKIDVISHLNCFAATNNITGQHLYIMTVAKIVAIPELKNYRFKGVEIYTLHSETEDKIDFYIYLVDNDLKDIFSSFIQNVLEEIEETVTESEAIKTTLNVVSKWKKLFDKINFNGLSIEEQKGLMGELLFLSTILDKKKPIANPVDAWTGVEQDFQAKDFTFGNVGVEVKFTASKQPRIKVSNERQLDVDNLSDLFLILYSTDAVKDNGISLNLMVEQIRQKISTEEERSLFNAKLQLNGYFEEDKEHYGRMYSLKRTFVFNVTPEFPKIIKGKLPLGIYDTSYSIEISAVENFIVEPEILFERI